MDTDRRRRGAGDSGDGGVIAWSCSRRVAGDGGALGGGDGRALGSGRGDVGTLGRGDALLDLPCSERGEILGKVLFLLYIFM